MWQRIKCLFGRHKYDPPLLAKFFSQSGVNSTNCIVCCSCGKLKEYMPELDLSDQMINAVTEPVDVALEPKEYSNITADRAWEAWEKKDYMLALRLTFDHGDNRDMTVDEDEDDRS